MEIIPLSKVLKESEIVALSPDADRRITVKLNYKGIEKRPLANDEEGATTYFIRSKRQFIYGKQNLHKGAFGIIPDELDGFESSQDLPAFDVDENKMLGEWLYYYLIRHHFYKTLKDKAKGTGSKRIHQDTFLSFEIPLPPKPEQERIIAKIKLLEGKAKKLKLEIDKANNFCKHYVTHYSSKLFQNETNWEPLVKLTERITKGESPGWQGYDYQEEGPLFVTSENVWNKQFKLNKVKHIPIEFHDKLNRSKIKKNDVLINLVGASIGRAAKYDLEIEDANVNQAVAVVTIKDGELKPDYLVNYYHSSYAQEAILGKRKNTARDNISLGNLRNLKVPKPDDARQDEVNATIDKLEKKITVFKIEITKLEQALDALVPSVLDKAFKGVW